MAPDLGVSNSFILLLVCTGFALWDELGSISTTVLLSLGLTDCCRGGLGNALDGFLSSVLTNKGLKPCSLS